MTATKPPQVDKVLRHETLVCLEHRIRREFLANLVRARLDELRGSSDKEQFDICTIASAVAADAERLLRPNLKGVINATGVVLNTNLGRAPMSSRLIQELQEVGGYCNLEIDLKAGKRGKRSSSIDTLLQMICGCEAGMVVNNNAAAIMLAVNVFARGKEVIVSRGELIEIGASFRLPDVIETAGATLKEVGTTNRTRLSDFKQAINARSGLMMRCHRSNFEIRGFTEGVTPEELSALSSETGIPFLEDLGSGVLVDLSEAGLKNEPTVQHVLSKGCSLVSFSGDKLFGGPQAGFIVGKRSLVERLSKDPMYRALRLDKLSLALIERTLISYLSPTPQQEIPVLQMLFLPAESLKARAEKFASTISGALPNLTCRAVETNGAAGGGSLPEEALPSWGVTIEIASIKPNRLAELMRAAALPIVGIVDNDRYMLDFRTVATSEEKNIAETILGIASQ